jgi:hypothetical protein
MTRRLAQGDAVHQIARMMPPSTRMFWPVV